MASEFQQRKIAGVYHAMDADSNGPLEEADFADGELSREEFRELWSGFWRGDDPQSPSQWVFGPHPGG